MGSIFVRFDSYGEIRMKDVIETVQYAFSGVLVVFVIVDYTTESMVATVYKKLS